MNDNTMNIVPEANVKRSPMESRTIQRGIFIGIMLSVGLIQFAIFWLYVNFDSILMAFRLSTKEGFVWTLDNFKRFFHEYSIPEYELSLALKNTLLLFLVGTIIGLPTSLLFAYYLYKKILFAKFFKRIYGNLIRWAR